MSISLLDDEYSTKNKTIHFNNIKKQKFLCQNGKKCS